ncbi:hypothetical protein ACOALZ_13770 [Nocardiopsis algeriensis]|uniref:hypothetical protein n=1 Tax=Nocardiopsis algeriensis TaxID=1478215 RepID=UPI003B42D000
MANARRIVNQLRKFDSRKGRPSAGGYRTPKRGSGKRGGSLLGKLERKGIPALRRLLARR